MGFARFPKSGKPKHRTDPVVAGPGQWPLRQLCQDKKPACNPGKMFFYRKVPISQNKAKKHCRMKRESLVTEKNDLEMSGTVLSTSTCSAKSRSQETSRPTYCAAIKASKALSPWSTWEQIKCNATSLRATKAKVAVWTHFDSSW